MRKVIAVLSIIFMLTLSACGSGGDVRNVEIPQWDASSIYTDADIEKAMQVVKDYFSKNFNGCTLTKLYYPGDSFAGEFSKYAEQYKAEEAIVLYSSFVVDSSGGDGSLNPNSTYNDWQWILIRNTGGEWEHADHGY